MKKLVSSSLAVMLLVSGTSGVLAKERDLVNHKKVEIYDKTVKKGKCKIDEMKKFNKLKESAKVWIDKFSEQEKEYQDLQVRIKESLSKLSQLDNKKVKRINEHVTKIQLIHDKNFVSSEELEKQLDSIAFGDKNGKEKDVEKQLIKIIQEARKSAEKDRRLVHASRDVLKKIEKAIERYERLKKEDKQDTTEVQKNNSVYAEKKTSVDK